MPEARALPPLTSVEREHSDRLLRRICEEIDRAGGWIGFARFMELALYEPGLGYYSAGAHKLGAAGDFVTAPEISPLFSRCLARQCAGIADELVPCDVLELGAGSGIMAADVLAELARVDRLPQRYAILEVSADLRERQRETLATHVPALVERVVWLDALPQGFRGVVLANEVLDAFPVERFRIRGKEVNALGVTWQLGRLDWSEARAGVELASAVRRLEEVLGQPLPNGYTSEICLRIGPWLDGLAAAVERGVMLFVDYGLPRSQYYRAERSDGTLLCHFRHRYHDDPFLNPGLQDIGAWVDFTAVAEAAVAAGLEVAGFTTQTHFLIGAGLEALLANPSEADLAARLQLSRQAMMLTLPGEMGERFKVIGLAKGYDRPLVGFSVRDLAATL